MLHSTACVARVSLLDGTPLHHIIVRRIILYFGMWLLDGVAVSDRDCAALEWAHVSIICYMLLWYNTKPCIVTIICTTKVHHVMQYHPTSYHTKLQYVMAQYANLLKHNGIFYSASGYELLAECDV